MKNVTKVELLSKKQTIIDWHRIKTAEDDRA